MPRPKKVRNLNQIVMIQAVDKPCFYCEKPIEEGRSDKRFCDNICRMAYNNALKQADNNLIRNINNAIIKNRRILQGIHTAGKSTITQKELIKAGFDFNYHTHTRENKNGNTYRYCYDYGYLITDRGLMIVQDKLLG